MLEVAVSCRQGYSRTAMVPGGVAGCCGCTALVATVEQEESR